MRDFDSPGLALCAVVATWNPVTNMCFCLWNFAELLFYFCILPAAVTLDSECWDVDAVGVVFACFVRLIIRSYADEAES